MAKDAVIIFPTDTVYGIGTSLSSPQGISRLYKLKKRRISKPSQVLVSSFEEVLDLVTDIPPVAYRLIEKYWPGPVTIIFNASPKVPKSIQGKGGTVGIRLPDHPQALELLRKLGPMAASSANLEGKPAPRSYEEIDERLIKAADKVIKGEVPLKMESAVVDVSGKHAIILREHAKKT